MSRDTLWVATLLLVTGLAGWREYVLHQDVRQVADEIGALRTTVEAGFARSSVEAAALGKEMTDQLGKLANRAFPEPPPSLSDLRGRKPQIDRAAVEAALAAAAPTGRLDELSFLSEREALSRFGAPNVVLTRDGVTTWMYKLDGFERILRLEFANGIVVNGYDR